METRVAIIAIIVEKTDAADKINEYLHSFGSYIIGRMGIPYKEKGINIICIAVDAPQNVINTLAGKIGNIPGVNAKTVYSCINTD
ncbi:MAG: iron-only hydrogenase system regulator [Bacillota bacterium]|nr:iron-only hydrogenase system regulator [Bacillota bacterium]